ncbi:MAG: response regulator [Kiritimatiellales bacterium]|nr:response regulator [Kiritimatiellales bacterium]
MSLKTRILLILIVASMASAVLTGVVLTYLIQLQAYITLEGNQTSGLTLLVIAVFLVSCLSILGLLSALLNNVAIIPAVEREMLDNEREMLTEQLHHSQKMEAVGRLAGSIAHDFNNLLTIIDGYSSLIISDPKSGETSAHAREIVEAARKASFITRKLLGFSHKEKTDPVVLDLNVTLTDTDKMLSRLIGEKIQLITRAAALPVLVKADSVQLGQVLMNLAVNARDAMPNGGRITIRISLEDIADGTRRKPDRLPAGSYAKISVRDTGHGIEPDIIDRIFEPFFTTKKSGTGTGLGLSIVHSIIKQMDGFIDLLSKPGSGTTFMIYLPLAELEVGDEPEAIVDVPIKPVPEQAARLVGATSTETILLVEDDPMIRTLVAQTLELQGYNVLLADDGWQAVQVARKYAGEIDLLFTDVVMPGLGGGELAVAVRELHPDIKVLFMSGYSRAQVTEEGVPPDAALLEKPFHPENVVAMVRQLLDGESAG